MVEALKSDLDIRGDSGEPPLYLNSLIENILDFPQAFFAEDEKSMSDRIKNICFKLEFLLTTFFFYKIMLLLKC